MNKNICFCCGENKIENCKNLNMAELTNIEKEFDLYEYKGKQPIILQNENTSFIGFIVSGIVKLVSVTHDGYEKTTDLLYPGDFIGRWPARESSLLPIATNKVKINFISSKNMEQHLKKCHQIERNIMRAALVTLEECRDFSIKINQMNAISRLAFLIINIRKKTKMDFKNNDNILKLPLSRGEISDLLSLKPETISRQFSILKSKGIIRLLQNRKIEIKDYEMLKNIAFKKANIKN